MEQVVFGHSIFCFYTTDLEKKNYLAYLKVSGISLDRLWLGQQ